MNTLRTLATLLLVLALLPLSAQTLPEEKEVDLPALYDRIDHAIKESPRHVEEFLRELRGFKEQFACAQDPEAKLLDAMQLFDMYRSFRNDSALRYCQYAVDLADSIGRANIAGQYRAKMARQCSNAGMYIEARDLLEQISPQQLDSEGLSDYYNAWSHLCGEIAAYSQLPRVRDYYFAKSDHYRDSLLQVVDLRSDDYLHLRMSTLVAQGKYDEAMRVSNDWMNKVTEGSREDALASYYRHIIYDRLGNQPMVKYWLGRSALADVECAVMDQASLITLAHLINYDGELERSYNYIRFTWDCNNRFNTRMRSSQISPVLNVIEQNYQRFVHRNTLILTVTSVVFTLLTLLLMAGFFYLRRQKRRLDQAQADLRRANEDLQEANNKLKWMNDKVTTYNRRLYAINHELKREQQTAE